MWCEGTLSLKEAHTPLFLYYPLKSCFSGVLHFHLHPCRPLEAWNLQENDETTHTARTPSHHDFTVPTEHEEKEIRSSEVSQEEGLGCPSLSPRAEALLVWLLLPNSPELRQLAPNISAAHFLSVRKGCLL